MGDLIEQVKAFFDRQEWNYSRLPDRDTLQMTVTMPGGTWEVFVDAREADSLLTVYSVAPFNVPKEKLAAMAEFQTRANYGLVIGNFEMDWDDGEIRFKTSLNFKGEPFSENLLNHLFNDNLRMMNTYLPGLEKIIDGLAPEEIFSSLYT